MPTELAARIAELTPSATLQVKRRADDLRAKGTDLIDFGLGEPDFNTPEQIKQAAQQAITANFTHYTDTRGTPALRAAVAEKYRRDYQAVYDPEREVLVSCGAKQALFNAMLALCQPGDQVILPAPYWVSYPEQIKLAGGEPLVLPSRPEQGFSLRAAELEAALTPRTKAVILNFPNNPSGAMIERAELEAMVELAIRQDFYLIYDECYEQFVYSDKPFSPAEFANDHTLIIGSCSKTYAMTGWRLGWAVGPAELIRPMGAIQSQSTSNPSSISQAAALAALSGDQDRVAEMIAEYRRRRDLLSQGLSAIPGVQCPTPPGAFYLFPNVEGWFGEEINNSVSLATYLLERAGVVTVPGAAFGAEGHLRFSYATSQEQIAEGLRRLRALFGRSSPTR
ncbi:MAG TPA: pyridoxal phosphate-dependent aminotransferase [Candidatus Fraserbacteria bacterium]|nr:pyridoxal phosphate-dependent aminotransferase [Candidatus Fraserbacteria bacterium]